MFPFFLFLDCRQLEGGQSRERGEAFEDDDGGDGGDGDDGWKEVDKKQTMNKNKCCRERGGLCGSGI